MASNNIPAFQSPISFANGTTISTIGVMYRGETSVALVPRPGGSGIQPVLFTFRRQATDEYRITVGDMTTGATQDDPPRVIASLQEGQNWIIDHYTHEQQGDVYTIKRLKLGFEYEAWTTNIDDGNIYLSPLRGTPTDNQYFRFEV
ncbi:hypothetical protein M404DRAFT_998040 [Pisolithus tinctorius Marx 270]|uniref:Uncharacterized protein n=1 Tax=Pisolithus tinctorius Marx 270 TaxID=870435 RepID=A0A0C3PIG1_PISTI|nr:hypothetical protein M404DRAFT_998040 [Pisolithus tinctorius Marx 270]